MTYSNPPFFLLRRPHCLLRFAMCWPLFVFSNSAGQIPVARDNPSCLPLLAEERWSPWPCVARQDVRGVKLGHWCVKSPLRDHWQTRHYVSTTTPLTQKQMGVVMSFKNKGFSVERHKKKSPLLLLPGVAARWHCFLSLIRCLQVVINR